MIIYLLLIIREVETVITTFLMNVSNILCVSVFYHYVRAHGVKVFRAEIYTTPLLTHDKDY